MICEDSGLKCTKKGVVYKASSLDCKSGMSDQESHGVGSVYIGETSRQFGRRALEHIKNVSFMKKNSFIVQHWMERHSLQTSAPKFKFEIVSTHRDALSRQLSEALQIRTQGNLNRKSEQAGAELGQAQPKLGFWFD